MDKPKKLWSSRKRNDKTRKIQIIKKPSVMMAFLLSVAFDYLTINLSVTITLPPATTLTK